MVNISVILQHQGWKTKLSLNSLILHHKNNKKKTKQTIFQSGMLTMNWGVSQPEE